MVAGFTDCFCCGFGCLFGLSLVRSVWALVLFLP